MKKNKLGLKKVTLRNLDEEQLRGIAGDNGGTGYTNCNCYGFSGNTNCGCYGSGYACTGSCNNTGCCATSTCDGTCVTYGGCPGTSTCECCQ